METRHQNVVILKITQSFMEIQTQQYCDTQNLKHDNIMRLNTKLSKIMEIFLKDGTTVNYNPYFLKILTAKRLMLEISKG